jgi:hypothetical protein
VWSPLAVSLSGWIPLARSAEMAVARRKTVEEADIWLKSALDAIRNERLAPLSDASGAIWRELALRSNVVLGPIELVGVGNRRKVKLDVRVDGVDGVALGVMSQGELNSLALAVFLPRATMAQSPFRFLVIDDPVQAMDPAKVEGLARVLDGLAQGRQVVVCTHDDRLPQAVRLLGIDATVIEVSRRLRSEVELTVGGDPAHTQLDDAMAVALSKEFPDGVRERVVPGYCRLALEAVLNDMIRRKLYAHGVAHDEVEEQIAAVTTLNTRSALALFGDASRGGDVLTRLGAFGNSARDVYQGANKGVHDGYAGDLPRLVRDTRQLVEQLQESA